MWIRNFIFLWRLTVKIENFRSEYFPNYGMTIRRQKLLQKFKYGMRISFSDLKFKISIQYLYEEISLSFF